MVEAQDNADNVVESGERLKKIRAHIKISQKDFAAQLGIAASYLSEIESGKTKPGYNFLIKLAEVFNVSPNWILLGTGGMFLTDSDEFLGNRDFGEQTESIRRLLDYFARSPLVKLSVMAFASKFLLTNESIIQKDIEKNQSKKKSDD